MQKAPSLLLSLSLTPTLASALVASFVLHLLAGFFSEGYYHADEMCQVIEFASAILGKTPLGDLPWEYRERVRSWFQPSVTAGLFVALSKLGVSHPFTQVTLLRALSAVLGWFSLWAFTLRFRHWIPSRRAWLVVLFSSVWFWGLPFVHARTSSESWAGSFFFLGASLSQPVLCGLLLGIAFWCRFQMGVVIAVWIVLLFYRNRNLKHFLLTGLGVSVALVAGVALDTHFYGQLTFSPYRYVFANLVENRAAAYGLFPWWHYVSVLAVSYFPPWGLFFLAATIFLLWRFPTHPLTLISVPFMAVHSMIGHKEARFLFPLVNAFPLCLAFAAQANERLLTRLRPLFWPFFVFNLMLTALACLVPIRMEMGLWRTLDQVSPARVYSLDPHILYAGGIHVHYLINEKNEYIYPQNETDLLSHMKGQTKAVVVTNGQNLPSMLQHDCRNIYDSRVSWLRNTALEKLIRVRVISIFECIFKSER